jgi:serine/threonine-protein phosphatase 2A regulatory subunit B
MDHSGTDWKFSQVFGGPSNLDAAPDVDAISTIEFDKTGDLLAIGDRGGRIVLLKKTDQQGDHGQPLFSLWCEFQSHEAEFDYLKSVEIEEKINKIRWLPKQYRGNFLLSTNDKTIKLWRVSETTVQTVANLNNEAANPSSPDELRIPKVVRKDPAIRCKPQRIYANGHAFHINSVSLNSDHENFVSSDDLRVTLWNLNNTNEGFTLVDMKPSNMEDLTEVITSSECHPQHCNIFVYSTSKGFLKLSDMRQKALCDNSAKVFVDTDEFKSRSFFSEIISSVSDVKFSKDGRYMISRDYMTLKLWDINMEARPVKKIEVHDHLKTRLVELYENDCIFDKFETAASHSSRYLVSGTYSNSFNVIDCQYDKTTKIEVARIEPSSRPNGTSLYKSKRASSIGTKSKSRRSEYDYDESGIDFTKKVMHVSWHPKEDLIAVGSSNNVYLYAKTDNQSL